MSRVLLVLRRVHTRIIRHDGDETAHDADIGKRHQRVGGDVQADVLHRRDDSGACHASPGGDFERDFFVRRPLTVDDVFIFVGDVFENFGRRRSGIARGQRHTGLVGSPGDRLVAGKKGFHSDRIWVGAIIHPII